MRPRFLLSIKLIPIILLGTAQLFSQNLDVTVHFHGDSVRSGTLISVSDTSAAFRFPQYQWDARTQETNISLIQAIEFVHTKPGNASKFTQILGATGGFIVGGVAGAAIGDAVVPEPEGFIKTRWGVVGTTLLGAAAGVYVGATIVNPSMKTEIRLDPNIPEQRDSLRVFLRTP